MDSEPMEFPEDVKEEFEESGCFSFSPSVGLISQLSDLCRVCAQSSREMVDIFSHAGFEKQLEEKISNFLPIQVTRDDVLPLQVCMQCVEQLESSHHHAQACAIADITLKSLLVKEEPFVADSPISCSNSNFSDIEYYSDLDNAYNTELEYNDVQPENVTENQNTPSECSDSQDEYVPGTQYTSSDVETILSEEFEVTPSKKYSIFFKNLSRTKNCNKAKKKVRQQSLCKNLSANLKCTDCDKLFFSFLQLKEHYLNIHELVGCTNCEDVFTDPQELVNHIQLQHPFLVTCRICDTVYQTETLLIEHFSNDHASYTPFICTLCNLNVKSSVELSLHEFSLHRKTYCCQICEAVFYCIEKLKEHNELNHLKSINSYNCGYEDCSYNTTNKRMLKNHIGRHLLNNKKKETKRKKRFIVKTETILKCNDCSDHFKSKRDMEIHYEKTHFGTPYLCRSCGVVSKTKQAFCCHVRNHLPGKWNFNCGICNCQFATEKIVLKHIKSHTYTEIINSKCKVLFTKTSDFYCKECNTYYYNKNILNKHNLKCHFPTDGKKFPCSVCGKRFKKVYSKTLHERTHMKVKPFACSVCDKSFSLQVYLDNHIRRYHTGEKPFLCELCGLAFSSKMLVYGHKRIVHQNFKKLYKCTVCEKAYELRSHLRAHERSIHEGMEQITGKHYKTFSEIKQLDLDKIEIYNCSICGKAFANNYCLRNHENNHKKTGKHKWRKTRFEKLLETKTAKKNNDLSANVNNASQGNVRQSEITQEISSISNGKIEPQVHSPQHADELHHNVQTVPGSDIQSQEGTEMLLPVEGVYRD